MFEQLELYKVETTNKNYLIFADSFNQAQKVIEDKYLTKVSSVEFLERTNQNIWEV